jgi:hypothetical protein
MIHIGGVEGKLHLFLTLALDGSQLHTPPWERNFGIHLIRGSVDLAAVLIAVEKTEASLLPGIQLHLAIPYAIIS